MTKEEAFDKAIQFHRFGLKGIKDILMPLKLWKSWQFITATIISVVIGVLVFSIEPKLSLSYVLNFVSTNLSVLPGLVAFSITSFVLVFNTANLEVFKKEVDLEGYTFYQKSIAVFAFTVYLLIIALLISYFGKLMLGFDIRIKILAIARLANSLYSTILVFVTVYSFLNFFDIAHNIFTVAQRTSLHNTIEANAKNENSDKSL